MISSGAGLRRATAWRRLSFRFSAHGTHAAGLAGEAGSGLAVEAWSFGRRNTTCRWLPSAAAETVRTQPIPAEDGRVAVIRNGQGTHQVSILVTGSTGTVEHPVAGLDVQGLRGLASQDPGTLAWLVAAHADDHSLLYRIDATNMHLHPVLEVPGRIVGEGWLNERGDRLAANHVVAGEARAVALDLRHGAVTPLPEATGTVLLTSPRRAGMLVALPGTERTRLGWTSPEETTVRLLPALGDLPGTLLPLAFDPGGRRLAVRVTEGVRSRLYVMAIDSGELQEIPTSPGVILAGGWSASGMRWLFSSPTEPAAIARAGDNGRPPAPVGASHGISHRWHDARAERFPGPAGPIEAVVYGEDWRTRPHLLIALHGGPAAAWDLTFNPTFQRLADAGFAIVAPNQRGSTGYRAAHREAIKGAWGGPDLHDIVQLLAYVHRQRDHPDCRPPVLAGVSYGAFLALLAAAAAPGLWSRCLAVAPFLSAARLFEDGSAGVRGLVERLDGASEVRDEFGPRDLLALAPRVEGPVLLIHGESDDVIPVSHSRRLACRMQATAVDITYREVPGGGHNPLDEPGGHDLLDEVVDFLLADPAARRPGGS